MRWHASLIAAAVVVATAHGAVAEMGAALVIGNSTYAEAPEAETAVRDARRVAAALEQAGWQVTLGTDLDRAGMRATIGAFAARLDGADQAVVFYSGHALRAQGLTYLAPADARGASLTDVLFDGVPLDLLLGLVGEKPGRAVVFLDGAQLRGFTPQAFAEPGLADLEGPEGVLIVSAAAPGQAIRRSPWRDSRFARLVTGPFLAPGANVMEVARGAASPTYVTGETDPGFVLVPGPDEGLTGGGGTLDREIELAYWRAAERSGEAADYRAYLERYPGGRFADQARRRLGVKAGAPAPEAVRIDPALAAEQALNLSRIRKRQVQTWLAALGHDPRGIDGLFGPGTRTALGRWQRGAGLTPSGYLDAAQFARLRIEGEAALAEEARRTAEARRAAEARDNAHWAATGAAGTAPGYRAYLERYPQGVHADEARTALARLAETEADHGTRRETRRYRRAEQRDTAEAYRDYLARYPNGIYADRALARLDRIEGAEQARLDRTRFERAEAALNLSAKDRQSVEARLRALGFATGPVDGRIDRRTRDAIGGYQAARGLQKSGYLDRPTVVTLVRETDRANRNKGQIDGAQVIRKLLEAMGR